MESRFDRLLFIAVKSPVADRIAPAARDLPLLIGKE
jgi:hypothetical protein